MRSVPTIDLSAYRADEFEEDIVEKEFCTDLGACPNGMRTIDEHMNSP